MIKLFEQFLNEHKLHKNQYQFLDYLDKLSRNKVFVFIDTETSGLGGPKKQQLTQISAVGYNYNFQSNILDEFGTFNKKIKISSDMKSRLKNPKDDIYRAFRFNHYGNKIKDDPKYYEEKDIISQFKNWLSHAGYYLDPLLIMQNASFDMNMIIGRGDGKKLGYDNISYEVLDTKQLLQLFVIPIIQKLAETNNEYKDFLNNVGTSARDFGLTTSAMGKWAPFFGIDMSGYHDGLTDCRITSQMFLKIVDLIKNNVDLDISKYQVERIKKQKGQS